jgi:hypothetical protein
LLGQWIAGGRNEEIAGKLKDGGVTFRQWLSPSFYLEVCESAIRVNDGCYWRLFITK